MHPAIKKITYVALLVAAFGLGYLISQQHNFDVTKKAVSSILPVRENNFDFKFVYPLLSYNFSSVRPFLEDTALSQKLVAYVATQIQIQNAQAVSVYYRNLLNNQWAGVNIDTQYHPGSMMKVVVMMGYFRMSQLNPLIMQKSFVYTRSVADKVAALNSATPSNLIVGDSYTVQTLIEKMIENSDNGADLLLLQNVDNKILDDILVDLNLSTPDKNPDYTISTNQYAALLRILYNATYLTEKDSEQAVSIMSQSTYHDGIYAGIPNNVIVAQKFGESLHEDSADQGMHIIELSNCGIVYVKDVYEICVMTKGQGSTPTDEKRLASIIESVSNIVYTYVIPHPSS